MSEKSVEWKAIKKLKASRKNFPKFNLFFYSIEILFYNNMTSKINEYEQIH